MTNYPPIDYKTPYRGRTRYDVDRGLWTQQAHITACRLVYPRLFSEPAANIEMVDCDLQGEAVADLKRLDGSHGIDKIAYVYADPNRFRLPLLHTIQERFQKPTNARQRNITITEWNGASDSASELYKMKGHWFVGGFFTDPPSSIIELVACPWATLNVAIHSGRVYSDVRSNDKQQTFLRVHIDEIRRANLASLHIRNDAVIYDDMDHALDEDESVSFEDEPEEVTPQNPLPPVLFVSGEAARRNAYYLHYDKMYRDTGEAHWKKLADEWGAAEGGCNR